MANLKKMTTNDIRRIFLEFFENKNHKILPSDSLVREDDPTLLFTSAGMNQFKKQFMGKDIEYPRVATCQKCLRTGDLEEVGKTPYHHTFFEMLGNFSFGDYFKKEAIVWSWEFLTETLGINPDSLWVSYYEKDDETRKIWKKDIKIPKDRMVHHNEKLNFWPAEASIKGPNGPCGPCSEIYYDRGKDKGCGREDCLPGNDCCNRYFEVWNLVFTQFQREGPIGEKVKLNPLSNKNIDTGMGLERMAQVLQNVESNFEIDIFKPIVNYIIKNTKAQYKKNPEVTSKINAISDHIRAVTFAICDGVIPSNEEKGYVIRKLIRKSKFMLSSLGLEKPFLYKIVPIIAEQMKRPYPELEKRRENISQIILEEEKKYDELKRTLPLRQEEYKKRVKDSAEAGIAAFESYDTHGIPKEITETWARSILGKNYREATFNNHYNTSMELQKERARKGSKIESDIFTTGLQDQISDLKPINFIGYKKLETETKVIAIISNGKRVDVASSGDEVQIILKDSPFYAEAGGQVGDKGIIKGENFEADVHDVKALNSIYLHYAKIKSKQVRVNDTVDAIVNKDRRLAIEKNHTATHLLQFALRKVLGPHVEQSGSLVDEKRLRFDFTHFKQVDQQQINRIEEIVNNCIQRNDNVNANIMSLDEAKKKNVLAFFKEKYGQKVRVVSVGEYSKELCGGTHIDSIGSIGLFKIVSEGSIASGVRRIEAVTAKEALSFINEKEQRLQKVQEILKTDLPQLPQSIQQLVNEYKELKKQMNSLKVDLLKAQVDEIISQVKEEKGIKIVACKVDVTDMNSLLMLSDMTKQKMKSGVIFIASVIQNKVIGIVATSADLVKKNISAHNIIQEINKELGSKGGGRPNLAQFGGGNPEKLQAAIKKSYEIVLKELAKIKKSN